MRHPIPSAAALLTSIPFALAQQASQVQWVRALEPGARRTAFHGPTFSNVLVWQGGTVFVDRMWSGFFSDGYDFEGQAADPVDVALGDYDGDGEADIAIAHGAAGVYVYKGSDHDGDTWWHLAVPAVGVAFADLDGDGKDELIVHDPDGAGLDGIVQAWHVASRTLIWSITGTGLEGFGGAVAVEPGATDTATALWISAPFGGTSVQGLLYRVDPATGARTLVATGTQSFGVLGLTGLAVLDGMLCAASPSHGVEVFDVSGPTAVSVHQGLVSGGAVQLFAVRDEERGESLVGGLDPAGVFRFFDVFSGQLRHTAHEPPNHWHSVVADVDRDGRPEILSVQDGGPPGATVSRLVAQSLDAAELRGGELQVSSATGGVQTLVGARPSATGQLYVWAAAFEFTETGGLPLPGGDVLPFVGAFVFPGAGAVGVVGPAGDFTLQWSIPAGAPIDTVVYHNVLTLDPATFTFADGNCVATIVVP